MCTLGTPGDGEWVPAGCKDNFGLINVHPRAWTKGGACVGASRIATVIHVIPKAPIARYLPTRRLVQSAAHSSSKQKFRRLALKPWKDLRSHWQKRSGICEWSDIAGFGLVVKSTGTHLPYGPSKPSLAIANAQIFVSQDAAPHSTRAYLERPHSREHIARCHESKQCRKLLSHPRSTPTSRPEIAHVHP